MSEKWECPGCGKEVRVSKGEGYGLALVRRLPNSQESHIWESDPYCSQECFDRSRDRLWSELQAAIKGEGWARQLLGPEP